MLALLCCSGALGFAPGMAPPVGPLCPARSVLRASHGLAMAAADTAEGTIPSFVQTEMRGAAMALHTRDQAPREGKQPAKRPVSDWKPGRAEYLQFLVDSRAVYRTLEEIVDSTEMFATFRNSGLERSAALDADIAWFGEQGLEEPDVKAQGRDYSAELRKMVS